MGATLLLCAVVTLPVSATFGAMTALLSKEVPPKAQHGP